VEQIKRFAILPVYWEPGGDEITPTMKLKRRAVTAKYADVIESLYAAAGESAYAGGATGPGGRPAPGGPH
jgi:long-chain acyl-CoA synthetase